MRKATPAKTSAKTSSSAKSARTTLTKQTKATPKAVKGRVRAAAPAKKAAPSKSKPRTATAKTAVKPQPKKVVATAAASKARPSKSAPVAKSATKSAPRQQPAPPRQPTRDEAAALKAFERAHKEFARGRFTDARNLFRALIEEHARVSEVTARARTYLAIAEARLRTESSLPRDPDSLYDRGVIELNRGDFVAAQEMFERALKRDPEAADTHYALAASRARLGAVEAALQALERAIELKPVLRIRAQTDSDLIALRNEPDFERVVFASPRP